LSNEVEKPDDPPAEIDDSAQILAETERVIVRLTFWQTVLSVAGVFIALVALYAALSESAAVRQQTAAGVWPFVQFTIEDYDSQESAGFSMSFRNSGVGPARMKGVRLTVNGQAIKNWADAARHVGGDRMSPVNRNFVSDRVLSPGEAVDMISTTEPGLARKLQAVISHPKNYITYCYCSIFEQCWLADSRGDVRSPEPVEACPDFGDATFRN